MKELVILEGPDCAGKTTLAADYVDKGWMYIHGTYHPGMDVVKHHKDILDRALSTTENVVIDRLYLSEYVYGNVYRDSWYGQEELHNLVQRLPYGTKKIICLPPLEVVKDHFIERLDQELYKKVDDLEKVWDMYYKILRDATPDSGWSRYDWTKEYIESGC